MTNNDSSIHSSGSDTKPVALLFGATGSLGSHLARALLQAGFEVVISGRNIAKLERLHDELEEQTGRAPAIYPVDLAGASPADYDEMAALIGEQYGRLDLLVHSALQFAGLMPLEQVSAEDFVTDLHVNLSAPWLVTQSCLPLLRDAAPSQVVFFDDDDELLGKPLWHTYAVAKRALQGLTTALTAELHSASVAVHLITPPPMRSAHRNKVWKDDQHGELADPAEVAQGIVDRLLSATGASV